MRTLFFKYHKAAREGHKLTGEWVTSIRGANGKIYYAASIRAITDYRIGNLDKNEAIADTTTTKLYDIRRLQYGPLVLYLLTVYVIKHDSKFEYKIEYE